MKRSRVMIVDDEKTTREGLARALRRHYDVVLAENGARALELMSEHPVDVVLTDLRMPGMDGMTLLQRMLGHSPQPVCILLTAYGSIETAVDAMKRGAYDFLTKPVNLDQLDISLKRALRARDMEEENRSLRAQLDDKFGMENMIGQSPSIREVFDTIRQVAPARANVLIQGETGTGKELVAQALHRLSPRAQGAFVAVHCASLPAALLESELFGHEKGAFTGAVERRAGRFELADGGTLFLDEIGEIDASVQVKILRVLEQRTFERVGGRDTLDVDVRLIAATNRDLKQMTLEKTFREDLYFRLNVVTIQLPSLRERLEDIPLLAQKFLEEFNRENSKEIEGLTPDAMNALLAYEWPGNIRELRNVMERMVVLSRQDRLSLRDIPAHIRKETTESSALHISGTDLSLESVEKNLILKALDAHNGNRTRAAKQLGISRRTLHRKLNEYGMRDEG